MAGVVTDVAAKTATIEMPIALRPGLPSWLWPRAAYVHIPFCAHKCGYCDFASLAGVDHLADRYLSALEREMATDSGGARRTSTRSSSEAELRPGLIRTSSSG